MRDHAIYHLTHVKNLEGILKKNSLLSDSLCRSESTTTVNAGYSHIKDRRMQIPVKCHPETFLGEYVPFNFCPRSIMLYVLHKGHETYHEGQKPMIHLVSNMGLGANTGKKWAFTDRHAALGYAQFYCNPEQEGELNWDIIQTSNWGNDAVKKEIKQAEFLVYQAFPWDSITEIGVFDKEMEEIVRRIISVSLHRPILKIRPNWYY